MDSLAVRFSPGGPVRPVFNLVDPLSSSRNDRSDMRSEAFWDDDVLSIRAWSHVPEDNTIFNTGSDEDPDIEIIPDWSLLHPDPHTLVYIDGYVQLDGSILDLNAPHRPDVVNLQKLASLLRCPPGTLSSWLSGSFLILIYYLEERKLVIVTDRLGSRMLFYTQVGERYYFSTELRHLLQISNVGRSLDLCSVAEFLRFSMILGDRTLYSQVKTLPPSSVLIVQAGRWELHTYWQPVFTERDGPPVSQSGQALTAAFKGALDRLSLDPGRTALMLSGGLDSRLIAAAITASGRDVRALSFGGFENREVQLARRVARACRLPFSFLKRPPDYYFHTLDLATALSQCLYTFHHAHFAGLHPHVHALGVDTLLHGWGLDLLFSASYLPRRTVHPLPGRSFRLIWPRELNGPEDLIASLLSKFSLPVDPLTAKLPSPGFREIWTAWPRQVIQDWVGRSRHFAGHPYNRHDWVILRHLSRFRSYLFPLSVRLGCRERNLLYDSCILDLYLRLPPHQRVCSRAYVRALAGLHKPLTAIPYSRTGVAVHAPEALQSLSCFLLPARQAIALRWRHHTRRYLDYPEERFDSYPDSDSLFRNTRLGIFAGKIFSAGALSDLGLLDHKVLIDMLRLHLAGRRDYADHLAVFLSLELWFRHAG
jgi:hypothetical protein